MVLLAIVRKYQQLHCLKRSTRTFLFPVTQVSRLGASQLTSRRGNCCRSQSEEEVYNPNKPPERPEIDACCENGCENCVWRKFAIDVRYHYGNDKKKNQEALDAIPFPHIKTFVEIEMKKLP